MATGTAGAADAAGSAGATEAAAAASTTDAADLTGTTGTTGDEGNEPIEPLREPESCGVSGVAAGVVGHGASRLSRSSWLRSWSFITLLVPNLSSPPFATPTPSPSTIKWRPDIQKNL